MKNDILSYGSSKEFQQDFKNAILEGNHDSIIDLIERTELEGSLSLILLSLIKFKIEDSEKNFDAYETFIEPVTHKLSLSEEQSIQNSKYSKVLNAIMGGIDKIFLAFEDKMLEALLMPIINEQSLRSEEVAEFLTKMEFSKYIYLVAVQSRLNLLNFLVTNTNDELTISTIENLDLPIEEYANNGLEIEQSTFIGKVIIDWIINNNCDKPLEELAEILSIFAKFKSEVFDEEADFGNFMHDIILLVSTEILEIISQVLQEKFINLCNSKNSEGLSPLDLVTNKIEDLKDSTFTEDELTISNKGDLDCYIDNLNQCKEFIIETLGVS